MTLSESLGVDLSSLGYSPVDDGNAKPAVAAPSKDQQPGFNPFLRCPLPPVWQSSPDSLRQFYQNGTYPQVRLFNPSSVATAGGSNETVTNVIGASSGGGGSSTTTATIKALTAAINTGSLAPNGTYVNIVNVSKSFQLLGITANNACRFQLYGTKSAQSGDAYRQIDVAPPAGSYQNIICDVVMDTAPYQWAFQDRVGANSDSPQTSNIYVTVTNLSSAQASLSLTLTYAPIVNV